MHKYYIEMRRLLSRLATRDRHPDPLDRLPLREWADLPTHHAERDPPG